MFNFTCVNPMDVAVIQYNILLISLNCIMPVSFKTIFCRCLG